MAVNIWEQWTIQEETLEVKPNTYHRAIQVTYLKRDEGREKERGRWGERERKKRWREEN